jgi:hypothetical protein
MRGATRTWGARWLSLLLLPATLAVAQDKTPAPSPAEQADAEKMIRDVFKDDYAKRGLPERQALARQLLEQGQKTQDDRKFQFVLLRESRDIAAQSGDPATSLQAVDEMTKSFAIEPSSMKLGALALAAKTARTAEDFKVLVKLSLRLVDQALGADDYDGADKSCAGAILYAKKAQDVSLVSRANSRTKDISDLRARFEKLRKARETLAANPDDAPSNLIVGQFLCFVKADWDKGLELLEKSPDPFFGAIAKKDRAAPGDPPSQMAVGDGWWDLSEKETSPAKENLKQRACVWYARAAGGLSGLNKTKVDKRLGEGRVAALLRGTWIDVTEPKLFNVPGKPGDPVEVVAKPTAITTLRMQFPKGDYDGVTARLVVEPAKSFSAFLIYESAAYALVVDAERGFFGNLKGAGSGWNLEFTDWWTKDPETILTVLLADGEYVLYMNGVEKHRVKTTKTRIEFLALESRNNTVKFDQIRLRRMD